MLNIRCFEPVEFIALPRIARVAFAERFAIFLKLPCVAGIAGIEVKLMDCRMSRFETARCALALQSAATLAWYIRNLSL
jgi:hypothetical protein